MKRRFRLFLVGFSIGIIVVIFAYGEKANTMFDWTPEGRVLKRLRLTEKVVNDSLQCLLDCNQFDAEKWKLLYDDGEVNFANARTKPFPIYTISLQNDSTPKIIISFSAEDELSVITEVIGSENCICP